MLFRKSYTLTIPEPCAEDWQQMHPADRGRFCDSCSKVVTDFTQMSEKEIASFFKNKPQNLCGRFTQGQLERKYTPSSTIVLPAHKRLIRYIMSVFLAGSALNEVKSQSKYTLIVQQDTVKKDSVVTEVLSLDSLQNEGDSIIAVIKDSVKPITSESEWKHMREIICTQPFIGNVVSITGYTVSKPEKQPIFPEFRKMIKDTFCRIAGKMNDSEEKENANPRIMGKNPVPPPKPAREEKTEAILPSFFTWRSKKGGNEPKKS